MNIYTHTYSGCKKLIPVYNNAVISWVQKSVILISVSSTFVEWNINILKLITVQVIYKKQYRKILI